MIFIMVILAVVVFASGCTDNQNNQTQPNKTVKNNTTAKAIDIVAVQKGPETAKKGMNVTVQYEVSNKGTQNVTDVQIVSQGVTQTIGLLKPGETKTYMTQLYIPTDAEVQQDFGPNATVSNPFFIGGFSVTFNDTKGSKHTINSNSIQIKLV